MNIMNITANYSKLSHYTMNDYYNLVNSDNSFKPYLWTSAYGLLTLIQNKYSKKDIKKYIKDVHHVLGTFGETKLSTQIYNVSLLENRNNTVNNKKKKNVCAYL